MARNEEGEFELMLGNKQLLSVFFLMVLLLCLCFVGGYLLGRSAAPVVTAVNEPPPQVVPAPVVPAPKTETVSKPEPIAKPEPAPTPAAPPTRTAPQVAEKAPEPTKEAAKAETKAKTAPAAEKSAPTKQIATKQGPATGQPVAGRTYLQLSATDKDKAEVMVDLLRRKNFAGIAAPVAERPGLFRVLVGPLADTAVAATKAQLKANGFPSDEAIRRVF